MRVPRRIAVSLKLALVCVFAAAALAQASAFRSDPRDGSAAAAKPSAFRAKGNLVGLYPGLSTKVRVKVTNRGASPITLTQLKAKVKSTTVGCSAGTLKISPFKGRKRIGRHATVTVRLPARLSASAPDACQGTRYQLSYTGKATSA